MLQVIVVGFGASASGMLWHLQHKRSKIASGAWLCQRVPAELLVAPRRPAHSHCNNTQATPSCKGRDPRYD